MCGALGKWVSTVSLREMAQRRGAERDRCKRRKFEICYFWLRIPHQGAVQQPTTLHPADIHDDHRQRCLWLPRALQCGGGFLAVCVGFKPVPPVVDSRGFNATAAHSIELMFIPFCVCAYSLKDPYASLKGFDVKGEISPIAAHCCAVIGSSSGKLVYSQRWISGALFFLYRTLIMDKAASPFRPRCIVKELVGVLHSSTVVLAGSPGRK